MIYATTISESSEYGITAAREAYNASLPQTIKDGVADVPNPALLPHNTAYLDFVMQRAVQSWCQQYAPVVVPDVPVVSVNGIPQSVPRRQAKTMMELTPDATHGNLWQAALAAADAIPDSAQRIITTNYLIDSNFFEHPKVSQLAIGLLGMKQAQVDALFVAAAKL